ncbi:unnamed protein product [Prorocentrum cordatum]|uniref:Uncharacterized protein n=1 Tax=Prorocentrum cordatum TaxID=2364126 RepID=A0ABN9VMH7_9DINO|nr:unnamed protein product [Polarella glacialis]
MVTVLFPSTGAACFVQMPSELRAVRPGYWKRAVVAARGVGKGMGGLCEGDRHVENMCVVVRPESARPGAEGSAPLGRVRSSARAPRGASPWSLEQERAHDADEGTEED